MKKTLTILYLLFASFTTHAQQSAHVDDKVTEAGVCQGKSIYIQTYDFNYREMGDLLKSSNLRTDLTMNGARLFPIENVWDTERRTARPMSRPLHQVDFKSGSTSDRECAEFLQTQITSKSIYPNSLPMMHPIDSQVSGVIVFWWSGRNSTGSY